MHTMDGVFSLPEATRADFLRSLVQSFGCAYICLWQPYDSPLSNRLFFLDGVYNNQSSSSLGSISAAAERLFNLYQRLSFVVNDDYVPGLAFRNNMPYLELQRLDLLKLASTIIQTQFYQEARIEAAVFMGCNKGEIEIGFKTKQIDIQTALGTLFPEDFSRLSQRPIDQNPPSSSSSSWRTLSTGSHSPECSSLLFSIPGTSQPYFPETLGVVPTLSQLPVPNTQTSPQQQQPLQPMQTISQIIPCHFPSQEAEQDAMVKALIHVISSPPSSTSYHHQQQHQNLPHSFVAHPEASAFKMYYRPDITPQMGSNNPRWQSLMKRSITFSRWLHSQMRKRFQFQAERSSASSHLHTISERRRREKLNENFEALRALLPPGTKKHKASILTATKETLKYLIAETEKLNIRNQQLTTLLSFKEAGIEEMNVSYSNERLNVRVTDVPGPSSSQERMVDLQVIVRGESSQSDIVIRLLEFLKHDQNVSLISLGANTHITEGTAINQINFRLRILEGSEWDESAFQEAVRRVVADLTH